VFVVRLNSGRDPRQFQLFRLEGRTPPALPVAINRVDDWVYEISPARPLYPGEYAASPMNSNESYCFGVEY
jgi:hypothetical protein